MDNDDHDPFLEEILDGAMAPYLGQLPPEQLAMVRQVLRQEMREDATAMRLLSAARSRAVPKQSGDVLVEGAAAKDDPAEPGRVVAFPRRRSG
jgi:hypothetical protein